MSQQPPPHDPDLSRRLADTPIAIVGLSALFPKSRDLRQFWSNIVAAQDCITDVPETHWRIDDYYDPDPTAPDKTYCRRGGFVPPTDFNPLEFGLPPNTLEVTDILQLLSLVLAREVLADAGAPGSAWYDAQRTGVVLGITGANSLTQPLATRLQTPVLKQVVRSCGLSDQDADEIADTFSKAFAPWEENSFPGMLGNVVAGRIANRFDLGGTNCTVDAACASSLAAVRMAIDELLLGRSDMMITGGCDAENTILMYLCFSKTPAFSKQGIIRPFDAEADGTLIGEGIGMLALKRLADAERDGDRIYAEIRGLGSSSDGRFKSIYAPRAGGQRLALNRAYADAGITPSDIGLIEAHGTGTAVGDQTEIDALREVYTEATQETGFVTIGSVKSQIGHTKAAAGAAGLIKLALALHHQVLPPTINVTNPNASILAPDSPFAVSTQARPWLLDPARPKRLAAVSAFGFGGTNFHCVLGEHRVAGASTPPPPLHDTARVLVWHAPDVASLRQLLAEGAEPVDGVVPADHARVTSAVVGQDGVTAVREKALAALDRNPDAGSWSLPQGIHYRRRAASGQVGALFAGQGSQYVGMGRTAVLAVPTLRAALEAANAQSVGEGTISGAVYPPTPFGEGALADAEERLRRTDIAQPAIGALSAGQYAFLRELGFAPHGFLGHSFGELTAVWAAGCLTDRDFHALARARGKAMAAAAGSGDAGSMAALATDAATARKLISAFPTLAVCNDNAPREVVVGGASDEIEKLLAAARQAGVTAKGLPVAAAFHTPFVAPAVPAFGAALAAVGFAAPSAPVYANTPGRSYGADAAANRQVLAEQLVNQVDFRARLQQMYADGFRVFVEFGPKGILSRLVAATLPHEDVVTVSLDGGPKKDGDLQLKLGIAALVAAGVPLADVNRYSPLPPVREPGRGRPIPLLGVNVVSDARRKAFEEALAKGYRAGEDSLRARETAATLAAATVAGPEGETATDPHEQDRQLKVADRLLGLLKDSHRAAVEAGHAGGTATGDDPADLATALATDDLVGAVPGGSATGGVTSAASVPVPAPAPVITLPTGSATGGAQAVITLPPSQPAADASTTPAAAAPSAAAPQAVISATVAAMPVQSTGTATLQLERPAPAQPSGLPSAEVAAALLEVVADKTGYGVDMLDLSMQVEADLGIDSIKRVEILGALRDRFPAAPVIGAEQLGEISTLGDIVALIAGSGSGNPPAATAEAAPVATPDATAVATPVAHAPVAVQPPVQPVADVDAGTIPDAFAVEAPGIARSVLRLAELPAPDRLTIPTGQVALVVDDGVRGQALAWGLQQAGWRVHVVTAPGATALPGAHQLAGWSEADLDAVVSRIIEGEGSLHLVAYLATADVADVAAAQQPLVHALLVAKATHAGLQRGAATGRSLFLTVSAVDGAFGTTGSAGAAQAIPGGLSGLVKTLAVETPEISCRHVDLAPELDAVAVADALVQEVADPDRGLREVARSATRRLGWVHDTPGVPDHTPTLGTDDLLVVTGGARGVTAACVLELARRYRPGFVLLGRTPLAPEPAWAATVPDSDLKTAAVAAARAAGEKPVPREIERTVTAIRAGREVRATLDGIVAAGGRAQYVAADVTDPQAVATALREHAGRVTGLVHGAGVLADQLVEKATADAAERVVTAKLTGLVNLLAAVDTPALRHVVLFSSVAGLYGNSGQASYAMANEALNRIASTLSARTPGRHVTAVNWGAWAGGMVSAQLAQMFAERGVTLIPVPAGATLLAEQFTAGRSGDVTVAIGPDTPLSSAAAVMPAGPLTLRRSLSGMGSHPALEAHRIAGNAVLPLSFALGAMVSAAEQVSAAPVVAAADVKVHKGVVFDGGEPEALDLALAADPAHPGLGAAVTVTGAWADGARRPAYAGRVHVDASALAAPAPRLVSGPVAAADVLYRDGTLFHGPKLQGVTGIVTEGLDGDELALVCSLPDTPVAAGSWGGSRYSPVLFDLLLQAGLVWAKARTDSSTLPLGVAGVQLHAPLPDGEPFTVVVRGTHPDASRCVVDVTAYASDGTPLQHLTGVTLIVKPDLADAARAQAALGSPA